MPAEIIIRDMQPGDLERMVEIALMAWEPIYEGFRRDMGEALFATVHPDWRQEKAQQIRQAAEPREGALALVAELEGQIVGFVTFFTRRDIPVGEIGNNAVAPDFRGRGIAGQLYDQAFERLKARGMRYVQVITGGDEAHAPARRAYEKAGFQARWRTVQYYRPL